MPSRSELPGEIKTRKFIRALQRVGFAIDLSGGDGSHFKIVWPSTEKSLTVQSKLRKDVLYYTLKEIEEKFGITWEQISKEL